MTSRGRIKYMVVFAKWLVKQGVFPNNPLQGIELPRLPKKIPKHLPLEKVEGLLRSARNCRFQTRFAQARAYATIATFVYTGLRKSELQKLEVRDVDLPRSVISVRSGKGCKDRFVAVPPQLQPILREYLLERNRLGAAHNPYFFVGVKLQGMLSDVILRRMISKIREASSIYFAPHMLRHTYATLMLEGGCDLYGLSKLMGHSDISTTTIYLSASVDHLQHQARKHPVRT